MNKLTKEVKNGYVEWLTGIEWSYWCTFTTKYDLSTKSARRLMDRFHARNNKTINTKMFWVVEQFKNKGGVHVHALLKIEDDIPKKAGWDCLFENYQIVSGSKKVENNNRTKFKTFNRVQFADYKPDKGVKCAEYCCKYVMKENGKRQSAEYDIYLSKNFTHGQIR